MKNIKLEKGFKLQMCNSNIMNESSKRGIFLSSVVLFSIFLILIPAEGYANEIDVESIGLEQTTIITVTNSSEENIKMFRIWLGENFDFESFKTEKGWVGEKTPQDVIVFRTSEAIKTDESVKFGIKTNEVYPNINWKALDENDKIIDTGVVKPTELSNVIKNPDLTFEENKKNNEGEIFSESIFKIIPEKPNAGSTIRVVGESFGESQLFDFYVNSNKIGIFETDENGHFITTMEIPDMETSERVDFKIKNNKGEEKVVSLRLGDEQNRIPESENIKLTVEGFKQIIYRGDILEISGKGVPDSAITATITNPKQIVINTRTAEVDSTGNWRLSEPINIPFDASFGRYSIVISDGQNNILKSWNIETDKLIILNSSKIKFDAGDIVKINGTVIPNLPIELVLEDNIGDEVVSDILQVDSSGFIEFEYQTIENEDKEGTWTLIATQGDYKEFVYVGYDVIPTIPVNLEFNKSNYQNIETAKITLIGEPSDNLKIIIIGPSGNVIGTDILIKLRADGRGEHNLKLTGFNSGIYTAVVQKGNTQNTETFSVGLQTGSGQIEAKITQTEYKQGERILLLGSTNSHSLLTAVLMDPSGKEIKRVEIPSNGEGIFTEERFRIPSNAITGLWKIQVVSGANMDVIEFNVFSNIKEGIELMITEDLEIAGFGTNMKLSITASHKTSIIAEILNEQNQLVDKLTCNTTSEFKCELIWTVTKDILPGTYTVKAYDAISEVQKTFEVD